jgi:hypothetical protein
MKKSTGIVFLIALALAGFVYFYDLKHKPASDTAADASKPAFSVASSDLKEIDVDRAGVKASFERRSDGWYMTRPLSARAEQTALNALENELPSVRVDRTIPAGPDNIASFGLKQPVVSLGFTTNSGAQHTLKIGAKDFSGSSVYALVDDGKDVALVSSSILTTSDKSIEDFRDHDLLQLNATDALSFELTNSSGQMSAVKQGDNWNFVKPRSAAADQDALISFLGSLTSGRLSKFVDDKPRDLSKYGLANPAIDFRIKLPNAKSAELQVGRKDGDEYYARDLSRPVVFRISDNVYKVLDKSFSDLRDKQFVHFFDSDVTRAEVRDPNGTFTCVRAGGGDLLLEQSPDQKGAPPSCSNLVQPLQILRAQQVYDNPPAGIRAELAKPAVQITLIDKAGKSTKIEATGISGDSVYVRTNAGPEIYKLEKQAFDSLNFKPQDAAPPAK